MAWIRELSKRARVYFRRVVSGMFVEPSAGMIRPLNFIREETSKSSSSKIGIDDDTASMSVHAPVS